MTFGLVVSLMAEIILLYLKKILLFGIFLETDLKLDTFHSHLLSH